MFNRWVGREDYLFYKRIAHFVEADAAVIENEFAANGVEVKGDDVGEGGERGEGQAGPGEGVEKRDGSGGGVEVGEPTVGGADPAKGGGDGEFDGEELVGG